MEPVLLRNRAGPLPSPARCPNCAMENVLNSPSVPLVVRVKRRADEDSLDVLRLRPLRTKIARGADGSAFELQNLQFLRAGTILETENLASRTADLTSGASNREESITISSPPEMALTSSSSLAAPAVAPPVNPRGTKAGQQAVLQQQMFLIAKKFRSVTADGLLPLVDHLGNVVLEESEVGIGSVVKGGKGKVLTDAADAKKSEINEASTDFVLCDLETVRMDMEEAPRKRRRNEVPDTVQPSSKITCNGVELLLELKQPSDFVYDIYTLKNMGAENTPMFSDVLTCLDDMDVILGTNSDNVLWEDPWLNGVVGDDDVEEDDDSNDEDNWRNDYPEEEDSTGNDSEGEEDTDGDSDTEPYEDDDFGRTNFTRFRSSARKDISSGSDEDSETKEVD